MTDRIETEALRALIAKMRKGPWLAHGAEVLEHREAAARAEPDIATMCIPWLHPDGYYVHRHDCSEAAENGWARETALATPAPVEASMALESAEMPYRIFTDTSRVWLDDDDGGSLFAYVREGVIPAPETAQEHRERVIQQSADYKAGFNAALRCGRAGEAATPAPVAGNALSNAARDVLTERQRQITVEGWSPKRDDAYQAGDLGNAAACYAMTDPVIDPDRPAPVDWPWAASWWKPTDRRRDLVKAGALILAEIERLDRATAQKGEA